MSETIIRTCPLCEATCGLEIELDGRRVVRVRGDRADVFSAGYICPKGAALGQLHGDPDRLTTPLIKREGRHVAASWDEAFTHINNQLGPILAADRNALGIYLGNPNAHNLDGLVHLRALAKAAGTRNVFSASTVDQMPKQVASALMFGGGLSVAVPDVDRCEHLLILGANPLASNGSLLTAPDLRGRLKRLRARGGRIVVIDPRRTRTAAAADEHHFIRPGTDALLLAAIATTIFEEGLSDPGATAALANGLDELPELLAGFDPESVADACGIEAPQIRRLARSFAAAERAAIYARIGTTTQEFGTVASWLVDLLNLITGNLDRPGGAMFPTPAAGATNTAGQPGRGRGVRIGRWHSRVRQLGEALGELPAICLAEEIDTPGPGRITALLTFAGNPALSLPNSARLEAALGQLDFMVSIDAYLNETTRHADVILPVPSPLERGHYDLALYQLAIRNVANYSPPALPLPPGMVEEWRTILRLLGVLSGLGPDADTDRLDEMIALEMARRESTNQGSPAEGRDPAEILAALGDLRGPERIVDLLLRCGPYGAGFGVPAAVSPGLSLELLLANPHGIDLGALQPRLPEVLRTPSGKIELCPPEITADLPRLAEARDRPNEPMVLIGRRDLRSNNSWMHNLPKLVSGPPRCTLLINPADATRLALNGSGQAAVSAAGQTILIPYDVSDEMMPGVVSIPHGWGHQSGGAALSVASQHAGVNSNLLSDELRYDIPSGNAILNGIPVTVSAA